MIKKIIGREILDSRGNPTIEVDVVLKSGVWSRASVPSGASTGIHEAVELRDGAKRYSGKGVLKALKNIKKIEKKLKNISVTKQKTIDKVMLDLDGTVNKRKLGANAILAVSIAIAKAAAIVKKESLQEYLGNAKRMPVPFCNVINGGVHAGNKLQVQEFMVVPIKTRSFKKRLQIVSEVYQQLKEIIKKEYGADAINVGDEGGFAPPLKTPEDALDLLNKAVKKSGYKDKINYAIDFAASEFYDKKTKKYELIKGKKFTGIQMIDYYSKLVKKYPLISIEDPFDQDDYDNWRILTKKLGKKVQIVGDDLLVTHPGRISFAIEQKLCNALLLKVNQIGTLSEAIFSARLARDAGWNVMVSHRSGETEDSFIADLTVGIGTGQLKAGAPCRGERVSKYNQLLRIEEMLGKKARY